MGVVWRRLLLACALLAQVGIGSTMPNYLAQDQILTLTTAGAWLIAFNPRTGEMLWHGGGGAGGVDLDGEDPSIGILIPNPSYIQGGAWSGIAVNRERTRLYLITHFGDLAIFDETMTLLNVVDVSGMIHGSPNSFEDVQVRNNGDVLILAMNNDLGFNGPQIIRVSSTGVFQHRYENLDPSNITQGGRHHCQFAISPDGNRIAYFDPVAAPTAYHVPFPFPPGIRGDDPDGNGGGFGKTLYVYDLEAEAPIDSYVVSADLDRHGVAIAQGNKLLVGASQGPLSCDVVVAVCNFADTNFGPGIAQRLTDGGVLEDTINVDPDCVWFEEPGVEGLQRDISGWFDPAQDWSVEFDFVIGNRDVTNPTKHHSLWSLGGPSSTSGWIWVGTFLDAGVQKIQFESGTGSDYFESPLNAAAVVESFKKYRAKLTYDSTAKSVTFTLNSALVATVTRDVTDTVDMDFSTFTFDLSQERLGLDLADGNISGDTADAGISTAKTYQNNVLVSESPLQKVADLTESLHGYDWSPLGGLEDWADRAGLENSPIGRTKAGTLFTTGKYVREFRNSRVMLSTRKLTGETHSFFLVDWQSWLGSSPTYANYPTALFANLIDVISLITEPTKRSEDHKGCCEVRKQDRPPSPARGNTTRPIDLVFDSQPVCSGGGNFLDAAEPVPAEGW